MEDYEQAVFISYAWGDEREELVNQLDKALQTREIKIIRDKRDLGYKGSIREFMERIGQGNCVIVVISDKYLRSPNCMFELAEIAENKQFHNRVFPIILGDANIYDPIKRIEYVRHWESKRAELAEAMKSLDPANLQGLRDDMDLYDRIRDEISELTSILKDMNTLTPEMHRNAEFEILYKAIEKRLREKTPVVIPHTSNQEGGAEGTKLLMNVSAEAVGGLFALQELMQHSKDVRNAVIAFRTDFRVAHEQVDRLGDYKELHDLLHRLQFQCYNLIAQTAFNFPNDPLAIDNLTDYALTLEHIAEKSKEVAARPFIPKEELIWIKDFDLVQAELHSAISDLEIRHLKKVIDRLKRLLGTQPAIINTLLNHSARALRLSELLAALQRVCDTMVSLQLDSDKVNTFQAGVDALGKLNQALNSLVEDHNRWQLLDRDLRLIDASIDRDLEDLELWWPDIKLKAEQLYWDCPDAWASALKKQSENLEDALSMRDVIKVRRGFRTYQHRAANRFYQVDVELKNLCGGVRQIGAPLASVLEMIE